MIRLIILLLVLSGNYDWSLQNENADSETLVGFLSMFFVISVNCSAA